MSIEQKWRLRQGDCMNNFWNATFTDNETIIIKTPTSCPFSQPNGYWILKNTLYSLQLSPWHWFENLTGNLKKTSLKASPHDPCAYMGYLIPGGNPIYIGIYVDAFLYFRESDTLEEQFRTSLSSKLQFLLAGQHRLVSRNLLWMVHQHLRQTLFPLVPV